MTEDWCSALGVSTGFVTSFWMGTPDCAKNMSRIRRHSSAVVALDISFCISSRCDVNGWAGVVGGVANGTFGDDIALGDCASEVKDRVDG